MIPTADGRPRSIELIPVTGIGEIHPGDILADVIAEAVRRRHRPAREGPELGEADSSPGLDHADASAEHRDAILGDGDVVVVTQKVVSKAEGRLVDVDPDDPLSHKAVVEAESVRIIRRRGDLIMSETRHGFVCANAGVDLSNVARGQAAILPLDSDRSARRIREGLRARLGVTVGVVVSDTFGRPWRRGVVDVAIGVAGVAGVVDLRGSEDALGRTLMVTEVCIADEIASAAELVMGKSAGIPVAVVRGVDPAWLREGSVASEVVRPHAEDLFR